MVTNITASNCFVVSSYAFANLNSSTVPSLFLSINPRRTRRRTQLRLQSLSFDLLGPKEKDPLRFCGIRKGDCRRRVCFGFVRMCKGREEEGDLGLEGEILEFMRKSSKPEAFPTKKELVDAGRMDLVEAILKQGGWLSLGWDLDDNNEAEESLQGDEIANWNSVMGKEFDNGGFQQRDDIGQGNSTLDGHEIRGFGIDSFENNSYPSTSSSGRSLDIGAEDESGVEGILSRLEKQRDILFGLDLREKGVGPRDSIDGGDDWQHESLFDAAVARHDRSRRHPSSSHTRGILNDKLSLKPQNIKSSGFDGLRNSLEPETWRTWTMQRAGYSNTEFEAAEIAFNRSREGPSNASKDETFEISEGNTEPLDRRKELNSSGEDINHNYIKTRLQHMELELASALHSFRSKSDKFNTQKDHEMPSEDFRTLSDAWEFQENDIMNAKDRLRSIRAKLAVIEGKMALAIIDAQKIVEEKQKRIDAAHRALHILHTACIVWPNSASEVLLTGSFDGWATQRKMKRSSTGVFSLCLKLYPGRYEIKFIVDGIWRIDPLRPIVHSHGYENNLLIIT